MATKLPSVNFDSQPGFNEWKFLHEIYSDEFFSRSLIMCNPGIVDRTGDPAAAEDSTRPLFVSVNQANTLTLDLTKGYAVTPSHKLIVLNDTLSAIPMPDVVADKLYVLIVEYKLIQSAETRINRFGNPAEVRVERPSAVPFGGEASTLPQVASIVSLTDFSNASLFSTERKNDLVVLAIIAAKADAITGQLSLLIDLTQTSFDFNRPWFSAVDVEHRSKTGSGAVTDNNPHGTQLQDLASAGFTLYQQILPRGGVFSKDLTYYGYPGTLCQELVSIARYQTDLTGEITADPKVDLELLAGRYFVTLTRVPVRVGSLYRTGEPWRPIPYFWKPGTRYLVLAALEQPLLYGQSLTFEYFSVSALMPPQEPLSLGVQSFEVTEPTANADYIVSGGLALDALNQTSLNLSAFAGPIKKAYNVLCNKDATLLLSPQNLVPVIRVRDLVTQTQIAVNQAPINGAPCRLTIGLTGVVESLSSSPGFDLNLKIRINGLDATGGTVEEDITFKASQWSEQSKTELVEEPLQFRFTKSTFQLINFVKILNTVTDPDNTGSEAILSIWANVAEAKENQELTNVASFFWDGAGGRRVTDERLIATSTNRDDQRSYRFPNQLPENDAAFTQELFTVLLNPPLTDPEHHSRRLALELDHDRAISETWKDFSTLDASGKIQVILYSLVTEGMTLRIADGKVLHFVGSAPDATLGEVLIPTSLLTGDVEIKNNLVTTINNPTFDSTWFAEAGNSDMTLTRALAYPDGFAACKRLKLLFSGSFLVGDIDFAVNGTPIDTVTSTGNHQTTLDLIVEAVNAISSVTGVTAVQIPAALNYIMFNGPDNGVGFTVTNPVLTGAVITVGISEPPDAFILTQPSNGILPTDHLPNRFISSESQWRYLSVAVPWVGVGLQATIAFANDVASNIQNLDQIEIVPSKILIARRALVPPAINPSAGEFLVNSVSLVDTLSSMRDTLNHPDFDSGAHAEITETALVGTFAPGGVSVGANTITIASHGLSTNTVVHLISSQTLPGGLTVNQDYYVVTPTLNTFQLSLTPSGTAIDITSVGAGVQSVYLNAGLMLLINIGGYASAQIQLLVESVPDTWLVEAYQPSGVGPGGSTGFLKALHPLDKAEWRYQLIQAASTIGTFLPADVTIDPVNQITLTGHGMSSGDIVYIQSSGAVPSGLVVNQNYYVVQVTTNTFKLATTPGGTPVKIFTGGTGTHTLFLNAPYGPGNWSPYQDMETVSPSAFKFSSPASTSLYCIQLRLQGQRGIPNGFSLYQLSPEVSGATLGSLDTRLDALDDPITGEVVVARGIAPSLSARLSQTINPDGSRVQDPELTESFISTVRPAQTTLKNRLDVDDGIDYWLTGGAENYLAPTAMGNKGIQNQLISGKLDVGNSDFFTAASPAAANLKLLGSPSTPLVLSLDGNYYRFARDVTVNLTGYTSGTYYIYAEIREYEYDFAPADVTAASDIITIPLHGFLVGDPVMFTSSGTLPTGLSAGVIYYVNSVATVNTFEVSATNYAPMSSVDITAQGTGTHTVTLVNQELGRTIHADQVSVTALAGTSTLTATTPFATSVSDMIELQKTPLVLYIPSTLVGTEAFFSPIISSPSSTEIEIAGQFPVDITSLTYFEIRSYKECYFTFSTTRDEHAKKLAVGQVSWNGTTVSLPAGVGGCYRYLDRFTSSISGLLNSSPSTYGVLTFNHNLGKIPTRFQLLYHTTATGDATPIIVQNDAIIAASTMQIQVTNRYDAVIVKDLTRTNLSTGYLQLII